MKKCKVITVSTVKGNQEEELEKAINPWLAQNYSIKCVECAWGSPQSWVIFLEKDV